jgi:hypothetical protein
MIYYLNKGKIPTIPTPHACGDGNVLMFFTYRIKIGL